MTANAPDEWKDIGSSKRDTVHQLLTETGVMKSFQSHLNCTDAEKEQDDRKNENGHGQVVTDTHKKIIILNISKS